MEHVRNVRLDNYCESIAEDRATMASARADEQGSIQGALKEMKAKAVNSYKHAGVELAFVAGADKLRVRVTKDNSDASTGSESGGETDDADMGDEPNTVNEDGIPF